MFAITGLFRDLQKGAEIKGKGGIENIRLEELAARQCADEKPMKLVLHCSSRALAGASREG
jgi:hypothetical protein